MDARVQGTGQQLTASWMSPAVQLSWQETAGNKSQAASASAFKTTKMSSLVMLWSKYFGHLDASFCACEIKCIINLSWLSDKVGRSDKYPGGRSRDSEHILVGTK